ncbi:MAG: hypothetical protein ACFFD4_24075 [Candidatus Odinarchaeota archaeon]
MARKKASYLKFLDSSWKEQIEAFQNYIDETNEAIKSKDYDEAIDIIDLLITGTHDYLEADVEDTGRIDRHHQAFIKQLVDLQLVKDHIFALQEKRILSFQSIIESFGILKEQSLFDLVTIYSQEIIKNLDKPEPKNHDESVSYMFLMNTFGLYCLEFQYKEAEYFFDQALEFLDKTQLPFSKNFFRCYIGRALMYEGNQKFEAALDIYKKFLDHVLETISDLSGWWKDENSEKLMLLKEAFFYTFIYAFYLSDEKTMAKAYLNFPLLKDKTMTSRLMHVIMISSEAQLRLQDVLVEAESFEDTYMIFDEVYQQSNLRGWKDRRVELKHPEAKIYLPRILNMIMESKPKYGILLIESSTEIDPEQVKFNLGGTLLKSIPIHAGEKHKYVELGGITFTVDADTVQVFASMLEAKKTNELVMNYRYWPDYTEKLALTEGGLVKFKKKELIRQLKLKDGGDEYLGRIWTRTETLTDLVRAIGKLPKSTFNFKYEQQFRQFCKEFSSVMKKIGRKEEAKILSHMAKQEFITGESVRLVIIQRLSEIGIKMGVSAEELESVTRDIILKEM